MCEVELVEVTSEQLTFMAGALALGCGVNLFPEVTEPVTEPVTVFVNGNARWCKGMPIEQFPCGEEIAKVIRRQGVLSSTQQKAFEKRLATEVFWRLTHNNGEPLFCVWEEEEEE